MIIIVSYVTGIYNKHATDVLISIKLQFRSKFILHEKINYFQK